MVGPGRWLTIGLALLLLVGGLLKLVSSLYYEVAHHSRWLGDLRRASVAAEVAATVLPGADAARALGGRLASIQGDSKGLLEAYRPVLRHAPADAYRWVELARSLAVTDDFGPEFDRAAERAHQLAPWSPAVHAVLADILWRYSGRLSETQRQWLYPSLRYTIHNQAERYRLLDSVARSRRQHAFCAEYGYALKRRNWCDTIDAELARCASGRKLNRHQLRWCQRMQALPP